MNDDVAAPVADLRALLAQATDALAGKTDSPRLDAALLLAEALQVSRAWLLAHPEHRPAPGTVTRFKRLLARRARGEPMAYLLQRREFWSLELRVTPAVLVPRADTECLVEQALSRIPEQRPATVLDLGTGSGAVALAIARERPCAQVIATDTSADALAVARDNATRLHLTNVAFVRAHWLQPLGAQCADCIVANPPYVAADDPHLHHTGLDHEPQSALVSAQAGLADLHAIADTALAALRPGGWLLLEHGATQAAALAARLRQAGFASVETARDLGGHPRVTLGRQP